MDDRDLLDRLRQDDRDAFETIFRQYYPQLAGFAESLVRDHGAAEDVAQDVMLELWRRRHAVVVEQTLRAYLFQATRNRALNFLRHARVEQRAAPELASVDAVSPVGTALLVEGEISAAVREAVADLPPRCREVFELSRFRHLKYAEIATALGISVKTVETQMGKALQLLRIRLAPWLAESGSA